MYQVATYDAGLVAQWCPDPKEPVVPPILVENVVAIPLEEDDPGAVVASGPADATAAGAEEKADEDVEAAKQARYISAFNPEAIPGACESEASLEIAALMQQLEDMDHAAQRSVAAEVESAVEGGACLVDDAGRERLLELAGEIRQRCAKLSRPEQQQKLQAELQKAALGLQEWQQPLVAMPMEF